ncbi:oligoendopeptidase F [Rubeoparvulum massiliense]|uniref:oligoendopeptidase F n=1 Tax=Rubeoparvulum massiliense TaxID=1631346 RepID=UPI00065E6AE9|nr:oligoendopeptidase F [Rubeoparvulum massiliense]
MGNAVRYHSRTEIPEKYKWDLQKMYESDAAWEQKFEEMKRRLPELKEYEGKLASSAKTLLEALQLKDYLLEHILRLYNYAHMSSDQDTANSTYQGLVDRAMGLYVQFGAAISYMTPELLAIPDETLEQYLQQPELSLYRHAIEQVTRLKAHVLSKEEEALLAQAGEIALAPNNIYNMLNNADLQFPNVHDEEGKEIPLTKGNFVPLQQSPDREVRKEVFHTFYERYKNYNNTFAAMLNAAVKRTVFNARVRKYSSALEAALDEDNIPVEVYSNLLETVEKYLPQMHRYIRLRKQLLGVDELHMYDIYTSMVKDVDLVIPYEEAKEKVVEGLQPLGEEYLQVVRKAYESRWIDVYETPGKRGGAYSSGTYGTAPYILLNQMDNLDSMFTLAHEMGHSVHSYYSRATQPFVYSDYTIFVAEVASTTNESLLIHHLLEQTNDRQLKMYLLNHYLDQFKGTVFRQTMFAEFEKLIHAHVEAGGSLTAEILNQFYLELNQKYYGPDMVSDPLIAVEWSRIPHFYNNFYVYKYATGFSAATALAQGILQKGEHAVAAYLQFLKSGGSAYSIQLLQRAGVDMTSTQPIAAALDVFTDILDQMEALMEE